MKIQIKITESLTQLEQMAAQFNFPIVDDTFHIPQALGSGFCRLYRLPYNIQLHHYQYLLRYQLEVASTNSAEDGMYMVNINLSNKLLDKRIRYEQYWLSQDGKNGALFYSPGNPSSGTNEINQPYEIVFFSIPQSSLENFVQQSRIPVENLGEMFCRYAEINEETIEALTYVLQNDQQDNYFLRQGKLLQLLGEILQQFFRGEDTFKSSKLKLEDVEKLLKVKETLQNHIFGTAPTIEMLAIQFGMSKSKLKADFKALFGRSIYQFYLEKKMKIAHALIKKNEGTISEIGHRLGYSNISQFSAQFKKQFGVAPSQTFD